MHDFEEPDNITITHNALIITILVSIAFGVLLGVSFGLAWAGA